MASTISIPVTDTDVNRTKRKRKKKSGPVIDDDIDRRRLAKWKSAEQHQSYSSNLLQALSSVSLNAPSPSAPRGGRAVREAADRELAAAAKGRTRWSRAILTGRLKLVKFRKLQKRHKHGAGSSSRPSSTSKNPRVNVVRLKGKSLPAVQRKVRVLGRLVPGCRKEPLPVILEEATDYIAALEMQVRAMTVLANLLSAGSISILNPPPT